MKRFKTHRGLANFLYRNVYVTVDNAGELLEIIGFVKFLKDAPVGITIPLAEARLIKNEDCSYEITNFPKDGLLVSLKK